MWLKEKEVSILIEKFKHIWIMVLCIVFTHRPEISTPGEESWLQQLQPTLHFSPAIQGERDFALSKVSLKWQA